MKADRHVYLKFFPSDWRGDEKLRLCSLEARGLWMELICLIARSPEPGHLLIDGRAPEIKELAQLAGCSVRALASGLGELTRRQVCSVTESGIIVSRRMQRDAARRHRNRLNGSHGGNPKLLSDNRLGDSRITGPVNRHHAKSDKPIVQSPEIHSPKPDQKAADSSALEASAEPQASVALSFQTVGPKAKHWALTDAQVSEWQTAYPGIDVYAEARRAWSWLNANPQKRKTPAGMPRFLVNWLNRATDQGRGGHPPSSTPRPRSLGPSYQGGHDCPHTPPCNSKTWCAAQQLRDQQKPAREA